MLKNNDEKITDKVKTIMEEFEKFIGPELVVGKPIKCDDVTIIPLVDVNFGLGFGFNDKVQNAMQGGGIGANMTPNSLLVIQNGVSRLISVKNSDSVTSLVPQILDRLNFDFIKAPGETKIKFESDDEE